MTEGEICALYRDAKHKKRQIKILSDLTLKSQMEIKRILVKHGFNVKNLPDTGRGAKGVAWYDEKAQNLYDMGFDVDSMAEAIGIPKQAVKDWHHRNGYEFNQVTGV